MSNSAGGVATHRRIPSRMPSCPTTRKVGRSYNNLTGDHLNEIPILFTLPHGPGVVYKLVRTCFVRTSRQASGRRRWRRCRDQDQPNPAKRPTLRYDDSGFLTTSIVP